jgi:hypothetical protein
MVATAEELWDGRTETDGDKESVTVRWLASDCDDEAEARSIVNSTAPTSINSLPRRTNTIDERVTERIWIVTLTYGIQDPSNQTAPDAVQTFETGGGTQHITQALATISSFGTVGDVEGAIGFDGKNVQGCDIVVPVYQWSETHFFDPDDIDAAYRAVLFGLTGKTNNATFRGLAIGECLFLGASGTRRNPTANQKWELSFQFTASPNRTGLVIGSFTGIAKKGWEYLSIQYADDVDGTSLIRKPKGGWIHRVYDSGDFSTLDIGTT